MTRTLDDQKLLRRLRHYRFNYPLERIRALLIEDGFDADAVDLALESALSDPSNSGAGTGRHVSPSGWARVLGLGVAAATLLLVVAVIGVLPWTLVFVLDQMWLMVPFAIWSVLLGAGLYAWVKSRYDWPNVSRGIGAGLIVGSIAFFVALWVLLNVPFVWVR